MNENLVNPYNLTMEPKKERGRPKVSEEHKLGVIKKNQEKNKLSNYHKEYYQKHNIEIKCPICNKLTSENKLKQHQLSQKCSRVEIENQLNQLKKPSSLTNLNDN